MSNGYDLRYSILDDARQIVYEEWNKKCDHLCRMWEHRRDVALRRDSILQTEKYNIEELVLPDPPTTEAIISKANELYEFVKKKD